MKNVFSIGQRVRYYGRTRIAIHRKNIRHTGRGQLSILDSGLSAVLQRLSENNGPAQCSATSERAGKWGVVSFWRQVAKNAQGIESQDPAAEALQVTDLCQRSDAYDDGDGVPDAADKCRLTPNAGQADADQDQLGDVCDSCPWATNQDQADVDGDLVGDACDNCPLIQNTYQNDRIKSCFNMRFPLRRPITI